MGKIIPSKYAHGDQKYPPYRAFKIRVYLEQLLDCMSIFVLKYKRKGKLIQFCMIQRAYLVKSANSTN